MCQVKVQKICKTRREKVKERKKVIKEKGIKEENKKIVLGRENYLLCRFENSHNLGAPNLDPHGGPYYS